MVQCSKCPKPFARASTLKRHLETKHSDLVTRLKCPKCDKSFVRADHWRRHYEDLHGDGRKACSNCLREFRQDYLKQHQSTCTQKLGLPGQIVVLNSGRFGKTRRAPGVSDTAALQQCLQASFAPMHMLQIPNRPGESQSLSPAAPARSRRKAQNRPAQLGIRERKEQHVRDLEAKLNLLTTTTSSLRSDNERLQRMMQRALTENEILRATTFSSRTTNHLAASQWDEIDVSMVEEPTLDDYAKIIESLRHEVPHYDEKGRVVMDTWPLSPENYPALHPFLVAMVEEMQQYSPELNIVATMRPCMVNVESDEVHKYMFLQLPHDTVRKLVPCILCKDCYYNHIVTGPEGVYLDFYNGHGRKRSHRRKLRERLVTNSETVKNAISVITKHDSASAQAYTSRLVNGKQSTRKLIEEYYIDYNECILVRAVENDEKDIFACLLEEYGYEASDTDPIFHRLVNSSVQLDVAKMLLFKGFRKFLTYTNDYGISILDRWIQGGRTDAAIELLNFASSHDKLSETPLETACNCGQPELIAAMLETSKDSFSRRQDFGKALYLALKYARVEGVRMLLEAGVEVDTLTNDQLKGLQAKAVNPTSSRNYPDAPAKVALLEEYRLFGPPGPWVIHNLV